MKLKFLLLLGFFWLGSSAQDVALYNQLNGRYDFTFVGNTMNPEENSYMVFPSILTESSADLALNPDDNILKAYLYWAGSGTGDFEVQLNGQPVVAERTFAYQRTTLTLTLDYFSAFADVTQLVQSQGNGTYTVSDLDVTAFVASHFQNRTNFAGWAILIVYENDALPLNQLNVYDGLQAVPSEINISLNSLNVIDNDGAKIAFLAWEGDVGLADTESLIINGTTLSNTLNPGTNAFNGTNSFTGSADLYNMDLDVYDIEDLIGIGDTSALIKITSNWDMVMVNTVVTKLNSQLPDATVAIDNIDLQCDSREVGVHFTVSNVNSTDVLPAGTPISIYADGVLVQYTETLGPIAIGESVSDFISFILPDNIPDEFTLTIVVDDGGEGQGIVTEIREDNNSDQETVSLLPAPILPDLSDVVACNLGGQSGVFDFSAYADLVDGLDQISFHTTEDDAINAVSPILNTQNYSAVALASIYVRVENELGCYVVGSFDLITRNCPPTVYNYISENGDGANDYFVIDGLYGIFPRFDISIYNRWGVRVWKGNQSMEPWDGTANEGALWNGNKVPSGTYYYLIDLYDPDYPGALTGWLFLSN